MKRATYVKIMYKEFPEEFFRTCSAEDFTIALRMCEPAALAQLLDHLEEYIMVHWLGRTVNKPYAYMLAPAVFEQSCAA